VAELRPGEDASALLAAADAALYQGKRAGRDRVVKRGD
jgi:PleD family two-component response regulator